MATINVNGQSYEVHEEVAEQFSKYMRKSKTIENMRDDVYQKRAYLLTEFGLNGSDCKKIHAWFNEVI